MEKITVQTIVNAPISKVWEYWNKPEHIMNWAFASDDWEAPSAKNDLRVGGNFVIKMAAKDKSASFDFGGTYSAVEENSLIEYSMPNGREVSTKFTETPEGTKIVQTFDPEEQNTAEMQRQGWQAILDNFKKYVER